MSEPLLTTKLPSEDQLALLARLCAERGMPMPAPASMQEASLFIDEIKRREYHPPEWADDETPF